MQQMQRFQQQQMMGQTPMQREGSNMDANMAAQQRPQTPGSGLDSAPSPKRQRLDGGAFNAPMGQLGRQQQQQQASMQLQKNRLAMDLQAKGIDPSQLTEADLNELQMQAAPGHPAKSMQNYSQAMAQQMQDAISSNGVKGMPNPQALPPQGSPVMDANGEFFAANQLRQGPGIPPGGANNQGQGNHALQDYQMQLMLLEQQNKKRLMMARQEQDSMNGSMPTGQGGQFATAMSPSGSRNGPSPNPDEQMKRGTPIMAPGGVPLPNTDPSMAQGRASPAPGFDTSQMNPNLPHNMYPQMQKMAGMIGPNGQMMQSGGHPAFVNGQMNGTVTSQAQLEMFMRQQQQQNGNRMPNGAWPQPAPSQMMQGGQAQPQQQPNMTPQQRNAAMPPPPAPATGDTGRTQPSSPQQPPAPPTPSQSNKPNPKGKKDGKANKVGRVLTHQRRGPNTDNLRRRVPRKRAARLPRRQWPIKNSRRRPLQPRP